MIEVIANAGAEIAKDVNHGVPLWSIPASIGGAGALWWLIRTGLVRGSVFFGKGNGNENGEAKDRAVCPLHENLAATVNRTEGKVDTLVMHLLPPEVSKKALERESDESGPE